LRGLARKSRGGPPVRQRGPKLRMMWRGTMVAAAHQLGGCFGLADGVDMSGATTLVMSVG